MSWYFCSSLICFLIIFLMAAWWMGLIAGCAVSSVIEICQLVLYRGLQMC